MTTEIQTQAQEMADYEHESMLVIEQDGELFIRSERDYDGDYSNVVEFFVPKPRISRETWDLIRFSGQR